MYFSTILKFCSRSGDHFTTAYMFAMKFYTDELEGFFYYLKLKFSSQNFINFITAKSFPIWHIKIKTTPKLVSNSRL